MNFSGVLTTNGGRYDLAQFDRSGTETDSFIAILLQNMHILYDWGAHYFFVCKIPFQIDYDKGEIVYHNEIPADEIKWRILSPEELHQLLSHVFEGEFGPSSADTISRLLRSRIEVDIFNTKKWGPENPKEFLEALREKIQP